MHPLAARRSLAPSPFPSVLLTILIRTALLCTCQPWPCLCRLSIFSASLLRPFLVPLPRSVFSCVLQALGTRCQVPRFPGVLFVAATPWIADGVVCARVCTACETLRGVAACAPTSLRREQKEGNIVLFLFAVLCQTPPFLPLATGRPTRTRRLLLFSVGILRIPVHAASLLPSSGGGRTHAASQRIRLFSPLGVALSPCAARNLWRFAGSRVRAEVKRWRIWRRIWVL